MRLKKQKTNKLYILYFIKIYYTYVRNKYLLFKTAPNCYTQKLLSSNPKNPQPKMTMLTLKRVREMFPHMESIEYKVWIFEDEQ